MLLYPFNFPFP
uniref:Uncharacterized protein n=1 Tax=Lepeophtheirus salmonis TaxID=72036 RepID=A0A0K2V1N4_LEPSM